MRIIFALPSHAVSALRSVTSSRYRSAASTTTSCINPARKSTGGLPWTAISIRSRSPEAYGKRPNSDSLPELRKSASRPASARRRNDLAMASDRQVAANRRNAARSTGPRTLDGKRRSRRNALRHGLTAETVIPTLEHVDDYRALETALFTDHAPATIVERELVARLASLLWRLRRATRIETEMLDLNQAQEVRSHHETPGLEIFFEILNQTSAKPTDQNIGPLLPHLSSLRVRNARPTMGSSAAIRYLEAYRKHSSAMKRLGRYETSLWRQVAQTLMTLEACARRCFPLLQLRKQKHSDAHNSK